MHYLKIIETMCFPIRLLFSVVFSVWYSSLSIDFILLFRFHGEETSSEASRSISFSRFDWCYAHFRVHFDHLDSPSESYVHRLIDQFFVDRSISLEQIKRLTGYTAKPEFLQQITWIAFHHSPLISKIDTVRAFHFGTHFLVEVWQS